MMGTEATVRRSPRARRIEAEWETGEDRFVVLSVSSGRGQLIASLRRERREMSCGLESRIFAPFQDLLHVARTPLARYSAKALEAFYAEALAMVERERVGEGAIAAFFAEGTTA